MEKLKDNLRHYFSTCPKVVFLAMLLVMSITLTLVSMKKTVTISIDGRETKFMTFKSNVKSALKSHAITLGQKDKIKPSLNSKLHDGDKIVIKRAVDVYVAVDGKNLKIKTAEDDVSSMLKAEKITFDDSDRIVPSKTDKVHKGLKVDITRVKSQVIKEEQELDYAVVYQNDDNLERGTQKVITEGQVGKKIITTKIYYEDNKEVSRKVISEAVTSTPVNKVIARGTLGTITASRGTKLYYTKSFTVRATAYSAGYASTGKFPGSPGYGRSATGTYVRRNSEGYSSIAVDPRVIPLGTKLYVEGYGLAIAEDTGGAIKGNTIDVFFNSDSEANSWGVRWLTVYILKWGAYAPYFY